MVNNYGFHCIENKIIRRVVMVVCFPFMFFLLPPIAVVEGMWNGFKESLTFAKEICVAVKELW
jgi:hypothetical protein